MARIHPVHGPVHRPDSARGQRSRSARCPQLHTLRPRARPAAALGACAAAVMLGACAQILGLEELRGHGADAAPSALEVRGVAYGVLAPVSLRLEHTGGSELLSVEEDGPFEFTTRLDTGASYAVVLVGEPPCVLENPSGTVRADGPALALACEPVLLSDLSVSGVAIPDIGFDPARSSYALDVSVLQQRVQVRATVASPDATVTVADLPMPGADGVSVPLGLGDNAIDVVVTHDSGAARAYRVDVRRGAEVAQHAYAKASNSGAGDELGFSLAMSGDLLAIGAPYEDSSATGVDGAQSDDPDTADSGAVYVFRRASSGEGGPVWVQEAYLKASNTGFEDNFGHSVALDGDVLAVGAPYEDSGATGVDGKQEDDDAGRDSGAVYVFRRSGAGTWAQEAYLKASNTGLEDNFGWAVSISGDTLAAGARFEDSGARGPDGGQGDEPGASDSGAVYVFRHEGAWSQEAYLKASNTGLEDNFGRSLVLARDTLAVGARFEDSSASGVNGEQEDDGQVNSGAVYLFRRAGSAWLQEAYVKASNPGFEDNFGLSLALDGDLLVVGAPYEDSGATGVDGNQANESTVDSGAVYVFRHDGSAWAQQAYIKASNTGTADNFGWSVALAGDLLAVGAIGESSAATGVDGNQNDNTAASSGAVYVLGGEDGVWAQETYLKASSNGADDWFGYSVALSGDTLAISARNEDGASTGVGSDPGTDGASNSGALYLLH